MATPIIMPRQGQSVESCIITAWNKKVGDTVEKGDILFSYETDKSSFDEPAPESGKLLAIFHEEGDDVPCLENVCVIGQDGEDFAQFAPASEEAPAAAPAAKEEAVTATVAEVAPAVETTAAEISGAISPRAKILAAKTGADLLKANPTGPNGRIIERDVQSLLDRGLTVSGAASANYTSAVEGSAEVGHGGVFGGGGGSIWKRFYSGRLSSSLVARPKPPPHTHSGGLGKWKITSRMDWGVFASCSSFFFYLLTNFICCSIGFW